MWPASVKKIKTNIIETMRKIFFLAAALVAAALTGCKNDKIDEPEEIVTPKDTIDTDTVPKAPEIDPGELMPFREPITKWYSSADYVIANQTQGTLVSTSVEKNRFGEETKTLVYQDARRFRRIEYKLERDRLVSVMALMLNNADYRSELLWTLSAKYPKVEKANYDHAIFIGCSEKQQGETATVAALGFSETQNTYLILRYLPWDDYFPSQSLFQ